MQSVQQVVATYLCMPTGAAAPVVRMSSYATKLNANAASAKRSRSAGSVSAALEYR